MILDLDRAAASLSRPRPVGPWPAGAPERDYLRSPAAARVGRLAHEQGLFLFHFEQRVTLDLPPDWVTPGREDDAQPPEWHDGELPESKYQSFRHDLYLGSFHPGHRGKWTTHELCHGLVGTAWRADASPLFHATASRLAELLPVVLWYLLDEIGLVRCEDHAGDGALHRAFCPACEAVAAARPPTDAELERWLRDADAFLDRELAAVARTVRLGRPVPHRWGPVDLTSDGLAYAAAHGARLDSEAFRLFAETFDVGFRTLDDLEARVVEVARAVCEGAPLSPGPGRWVEQDLAWRVLQVAELSAPSAREALHALVPRLAAGEVAGVLADWPDLAREHDLLDAEAVFAVGYDLPGGLGRSVPLIREGLSTVTPLALELVEESGLPWLGAFVAEDPPSRRPLGDRFADWLAPRQPLLADLARFEAALRHAGGDGVAGSLGPEGEGPWRLARGVRVLVSLHDPSLLAERVDVGEVWACADGEALVLQGEVPPEDPTGLLVARDARGDALVLECAVETAEALARGDEPELDAEERRILKASGVLVPSRWPLCRAINPGSSVASGGGDAG